MYTDTLIKIFASNFDKLKHDITLYHNKSNLWLLEKSISNLAGNICLHLIGNLNHFIGSVLGDTGYIRQRELEFSLKNVSRIDILADIDATILVVEKALRRLAFNDLDNQYPIQVFKEPMTSEYFLTHLVNHLSYHLRQINYHRRSLDA